MISNYLNQTATWKRVTSLNEFGEPVTASQTIAVRWEGKRRLVRDRQGQEVVSEARMYCVEAVQPGDVVEYEGREWPVLAVSETPGLDGTVLYREVAL